MTARLALPAKGDGTMSNDLVCAWCDVYCRVERGHQDEAGREITHDTACAYCGRTELRFARGGRTKRSSRQPLKISGSLDGVPFEATEEDIPF